MSEVDYLDPDHRAALVDAALKLLHVPGGKLGQARELIEIVERTYAKAEESAIGTEANPIKRIKDASDSLQAIAGHAHELARALRQTPLQDIAAAYGSLGDWPGVAKFSLLFDTIQWKTYCEGLEDLAALANYLLHRLPPDRGGRGTLRTKTRLTPKELLTLQCWELFWHFRPRKDGLGSEATGSSEGEYAELVRAIYELATGRDPNEECEHAGLERYIKQVASACNKLFENRPEFDLLRRKLAPNESPLGMISQTPLGLMLLDKSTNLLDSVRQFRTDRESSPPGTQPKENRGG